MIMTWREAFWRQARSDHRVLMHLGASGFEACHRLHFYQMATEKLAKAWLTSPAAVEPPPHVHKGFVRMLQIIKSQPGVRRRLGYSNAAVFARSINALLDLATNVERLAPALAAGSRPNPEYPWRDAQSGELCVPAEFHFPAFDPRNPQMAKLDKLVLALLTNFA